MRRDEIIRALQRLGERLAARGATGEVLLLGGAAMCLAYDARGLTRDVDAVFEPAQVVRHEAQAVAAELDLASDWLNDAAKGFLSTAPMGCRHSVMQAPGLRVWAPPPEYLFAMKCLAARAEDRADIETLARLTGIRTYEEAAATVLRFYPAERVPPRTRFTLEELFAASGGSPPA